MPTPAEKYAGKMANAIETKPGDFTVLGQVVAFVTPDGRCRFMAGDLTPQEARALRDWIKDKFIDGSVIQ